MTMILGMRMHEYDNDDDFSIGRSAAIAHEIRNILTWATRADAAAHSVLNTLPQLIQPGSGRQLRQSAAGLSLDAYAMIECGDF